ncbi:MAG: proline dehydrogenase family protein [Actinomycetes bacterium]
MLRRPILAASRSNLIKRTVSTAPISRSVVRRFVAGETVEDAVQVTRELVGAGLHVSLDHLGEDTTDAGQAEAATKAYLTLLSRLADEGLTSGAEVSVKLSAVGQRLDEQLALDNARTICDAAASAGTTVTLDMEDHTTTDSTLRVLGALRSDFPTTGAVLQAYLRRSEADCHALAQSGSRVRLCKGAYDEPDGVAFRRRDDVDFSFARCLGVLMAGRGYPMVATHDPRLVELARALAVEYHRRRDSFEYQMLYGVRPDEQRRLAGEGNQVRVYVPYGTEWYGYLMRRLAERPANVAFFLRAVATKS